MGRVFVLGAGASKFAGYPLGLELWSFVRDLSGGDVMAKRRRKEVVEEVERILKVVPPAQHDSPNLEELFTLLDLASLGTALLALRDLDWPRLRRKVMGMIADAFQWHAYRLQREVLDKEHDFGLGLNREICLAVLDAWASYLGAGDTIITFNWDILHEVALWRAGKWHYADGYGFSPPDEVSPSKSEVRILKMHGSVNWAQQDEQDSTPAIEHKMDFFRGAFDAPGTYRRARGQWNAGRYLIIPSYLKDLSSNRLLLSIWNQASEALSFADEVVVIGLQLHSADGPARHLIASALMRNTKVSSITIISPDGGGMHWDNFCLRTGLSRKPVFARFEGWVRGGIALP